MLPGNTIHHKAHGKPDKRLDLYKTEMCRNWAEMGYCRYGKKCRFAHGEQELRMVQRHVRYKTEICRTYHRTGTCLYGVRCTFIHDNDDDTTSTSSTISVDDVQLEDMILAATAIAAAAGSGAGDIGSPSMYHRQNITFGVSKKRLGAFSSICNHHDPWQSSTPAYEHPHLSSSWQ
ncbi:hypothetical protein BX666DRAFT_2006811 [Dichotomocladium elegans]|nr:hypothetical protein BX666DRAFT_2006811 [Dichotomocladium elegans]